MAAPKNIRNKAEQLNKALAKVAKLSNEIADWAGEHGADDNDFFHEYRLDMPFEFDLDDVLEALDDLA